MGPRRRLMARTRPVRAVLPGLILVTGTALSSGAEPVLPADAPTTAGRLTAHSSSLEDPIRFHRVSAREVDVAVRGTHLVDPATVSGRTDDPRHRVRALVHLPVAYDRHPRRHYPLLVLLHGAGGDSRTWSEQAALINDPDLDSTVVVALDGGRYGMYTDWAAQGSAAWQTLHRQIVDAVVARFRVLPSRRAHAVAGVSMGGQGALRYASLWPDVFGSAVAISPGLPNMRAPEAVATYPVQISQKAGTPVTYEDTWGPVDGDRSVGANPTDLTGNLEDSRVLVITGTGETCAGADGGSPAQTVTEAAIRFQSEAYARRLATQSIPVTLRVECGVHGDWSRWTEDLDYALRDWRPFGRVETHPRSWRYRTAAVSGRVWDVAWTSSRDRVRLLDMRLRNQRLGLVGRGHYLITTPYCSLRLRLPARMDMVTCKILAHTD